MNDEQYIKMLLKFFKGKINVNGILCYPLGIFEGNMGPDIIKFRMENPNDLSYTKPGLEGQLSDQVDFFNRLAGMGEHSRFNVRIENIKDIYTKNDVNDYVSSVLKGKTILRSNNYEDEETIRKQMKAELKAKYKQKYQPPNYPYFPHYMYAPPPQPPVKEVVQPVVMTPPDTSTYVKSIARDELSKKMNDDMLKIAMKSIFG